MCVETLTDRPVIFKDVILRVTDTSKYRMVDAKKNDGVVPLESGLLVCGQIAIVLIGAFPMVKWIKQTFGGALEKIGNALGMNESGSAGLVANLANNIAMLPSSKRPAFKRSRAPGTLSSIHLIFVALKYESIISPVFSRTMFPYFSVS